MEIILLERVTHLGQIGDVVTVKPGYARNFLLPQKKALRATKANREVFERQKAQLLARNQELKKEAEALAKKMGGLKVVVIRQAGETGMLYGSVNGRDIADAVKEKGFAVDRGQVSIASPIKALGLFQVQVDLHPEVPVNVTVNVARSEEGAAVQFERGTAVVTVHETAEQTWDQPAPEENQDASAA
ncbi:MAG: 50S ribosomal protein L9 [Pseudomonadota bacterium]|nr:50S ribosomal protein L9 [Pseudomonadota bacterium]